MSTIIMILLISVLILVHEAGHFFSARLFKIKVDKFGIGLPIGPTLFEKKVGDITLVIRDICLSDKRDFPANNPTNTIITKHPTPIFTIKPLIFLGIADNKNTTITIKKYIIAVPKSGCKKIAKKPTKHINNGYKTFPHFSKFFLLSS